MDQADKNIKKAIIRMSHRLRKIEINIKTMKREMEDTKKNPIELLKVKNAIFEIKNILHVVKSKSDNTRKDW